MVYSSTVALVQANSIKSHQLYVDRVIPALYFASAAHVITCCLADALMDNPIFLLT